MDQRERIGDKTEALRSAIEGQLAGLWTALPGIVQSVNFAQMTCVVQPSIRAFVTAENGQQSWVKLPLLLDVPIVFPSAGGFAITLPISSGDEVLVIFASRSIDAWWQNSGVGNQVELRMHDLSDGFCIPGPKSLPNVLPGISNNSAQLRTKDGSAYIELAAGGIVNIKAPGGVNINGNTAVTGTMHATGEGTFNGGHTVSAHIHGGVTTGGGSTAPPTG